MTQRFFTEAGFALLALAVFASIASEESPEVAAATVAAVADDGEGTGNDQAPAPQAGDPAKHARAPHGVSLEVGEGTWLRAPGEDWFARQAELDPSRFQRVENAVDGQAAWVDQEGEYHYRLEEESGEYAYWQWVSPERLTRGRREFVQFCASCHGLEGDGYGRSGQHLRPPPRDFRQSNFKFTKVLANLPTDEALMRLIRRGLEGTPMYPWDLSDRQLGDIVQYIKSLSPPEQGWRDVYIEIGDVVEAGEDPWEGRLDRARKRGEEVYHGTGTCYACHPGYATPQRVAEIRGDAPGTAYRENLSYPELKDSDYRVGEKQIFFLPPDFTWHQLRSGIEPRDLFETIASGIKGTAMPQWKGSIPDEDLWALAHYVRGLIDDYKGKPDARAKFMAHLRGE